MKPNINFFDNLDNDWSDVLADTYNQTTIDTNTLIIYDLKKLGIEQLIKIDVYDYIIKLYEKNVAPITSSDKILLSIKLKNDINFIKHSYISSKQCIVSFTYDEVEVLINNYDIMPYIIHSLAFDLGDDYVEEMTFLTFTIRYEPIQFNFSGLEVAQDEIFGKLSFSKNSEYDLECMKIVSFLNLKKFEPYIGIEKYKETRELSKTVLPNANIN